MRIREGLEPSNAISRMKGSPGAPLRGLPVLRVHNHPSQILILSQLSIFEREKTRLAEQVGPMADNRAISELTP
ncbi:MAG TPA: hypothetical protein VK040_07160 [Balneolaceae bacterium]|nr:hypothetical protein [Balneolaceae bacterium]